MTNGASASLAATTGTKVVARGATWTYGYKNTVAYPPGTYTGGVTYSIANP